MFRPVKFKGCGGTYRQKRRWRIIEACSPMYSWRPWPHNKHSLGPCLRPPCGKTHQIDQRMTWLDAPMFCPWTTWNPQRQHPGTLQRADCGSVAVTWTHGRLRHLQRSRAQLSLTLRCQELLLLLLRRATYNWFSHVPPHIRCFNPKATLFTSLLPVHSRLAAGTLPRCHPWERTVVALCAARQLCHLPLQSSC